MFLKKMTTYIPPSVMMISRLCFHLPSLMSWLLEQDAASITEASANQRAEAHNALRRSAANQHNTARAYRATSRCTISCLFSR